MTDEIDDENAASEDEDPKLRLIEAKKTRRGQEHVVERVKRLRPDFKLTEEQASEASPVRLRATWTAPDGSPCMKAALVRPEALTGARGQLLAKVEQDIEEGRS